MSQLETFNKISLEEIITNVEKIKQMKSTNQLILLQIYTQISHLLTPPADKLEFTHRYYAQHCYTVNHQQTGPEIGYHSIQQDTIGTQ